MRFAFGVKFPGELPSFFCKAVKPIAAALEATFKNKVSNAAPTDCLLGPVSLTPLPLNIELKANSGITSSQTTLPHVPINPNQCPNKNQNDAGPNVGSLAKTFQHRFPAFRG